MELGYEQLVEELRERFPNMGSASLQRMASPLYKHGVRCVEDIKDIDVGDAMLHWSGFGKVLAERCLELGARGSVKKPVPLEEFKKLYCPFCKDEMVPGHRTRIAFLEEELQGDYVKKSSTSVLCCRKCADGVKAKVGLC